MEKPPRAKQFTIAAISLAGGLALGFSFATPSSSDATDKDGPKKKLSATSTSSSDALAVKMAALFNGKSETAEVIQQFDQLSLADAMRLAKRLDGRDWLSGSESKTLQHAFSRWAELDPAGAVDWITKPGHARALADDDYGLKLAFAKLAEADLEFALDRFTKLEPVHRRAAVEALAAPFARQNPQAALAFFVEQKSSQGQQAALSEWTKTDPMGAIAAADKYTTNLVNYTHLAVQEWAIHEPEKAIDWAIASDVDPSQKANLFGRIALRLAMSDPASAIRALNQIPPGYRNQYLQMFTERWAKDDPESAMMWVKDLPDPFSRKQAIENLVYQYSMTHPELARELGESLSSSKSRDSAFGTLVARRAEADVEEALTWAKSLENPDQRLIAVQNSLTVLAASQPKRAIEYVLETEDATEKRSMMEHMIANANFRNDQMPEMREVVSNMSRADERLTVEVLLETQGNDIPAPVRLLLRTTKKLGPLLDWMANGEE